MDTPTTTTTNATPDPAREVAAKLGAAQESLRVALTHSLVRTLDALRGAPATPTVAGVEEVLRHLEETSEIGRAWLNLGLVPAPTAAQGTLFGGAPPAAATTREPPKRRATPNTPRGRKVAAEEIKASTKAGKREVAAYAARAPRLAKLKRRGNGPVLPGDLADAFMAFLRETAPQLAEKTVGALAWRARTGQKLPGYAASVLEKTLKLKKVG